jgi:hypothetical protein
LAAVVLVGHQAQTAATVLIQLLLVTHQLAVATERVTISKVVLAVLAVVLDESLQLVVAVTTHQHHLHRVTTAVRELITLQTALAVVAVAVAEQDKAMLLRHLTVVLVELHLLLMPWAQLHQRVNYQEVIIITLVAVAVVQAQAEAKQLVVLAAVVLAATTADSKTQQEQPTQAVAVVAVLTLVVLVQLAVQELLL